jgi:hypothetical protein
MVSGILWRHSSVPEHRTYNREVGAFKSLCRYHSISTMTQYTWHQIRNDWLAFEDAIEKRREVLRCSYLGAWFRGQENSAWQLLPSAFRPKPPQGLSSQALSDFRGRVPVASDLRRSCKLAIDENSTEGDVETDIKLRIRDASLEISKLLQKIEDLDSRVERLSDSSSLLRRQASGENNAAIPEMREAKKSLEQSRSNIADRLMAQREQMLTLRSLRYGEKDGYSLFRSRVSLPALNSSWEVLAAMQHYGAPTRLLD